MSTVHSNLNNVLLFTRLAANATTLFSVVTHNGIFLCYAFENVIKSFPNGDYLMSWYNSPRFNKKVLLLEVPNRSYIEVHPANYFTQLRGCIAPVSTITNKGGWSSVKAVKVIEEALPRDGCLVARFVGYTPMDGLQLSI